MECIPVYFIMILFASATFPKDICESCVPTDQCPLFANLSKGNQQLWMERFPCRTPLRNQYTVPPGFAITAKGDYVCCSNKIWGSAESSGTYPLPTHYNSIGTLTETNSYIIPEQEDNKYSTGDQNNGTLWYPGREQNYNNKNYWSNNNQGPPILSNKNRIVTSNPNMNRWTNNRNKYWNERPESARNYGNQNGINNNNRQDTRYGYENSFRTNQRPPYYNYETTQRPNEMNRPRQQDYNQGYERNPNYFVTNKPYPTQSYYPNSNNGNNGNSVGGQCDRLTSFPPDPQSNCCGRELVDDDRITGGKATELYQYPWTVLLLTTFDYGNRQTGFNCGGSLISAKYVLSAGHCVYDKSAVVKSVEVYLAEYDTRTFPRDCKLSHNRRKCIENKVMYAENIVLHPQYENENLLNDISLIRLQGTAPYTEYIRPICLPSINIDEPKFSNLRFEVTGWGRNGQYRSNVKQSTVLHLVNQNDCRRFYPMLTTKHLCAAGYKGEDTCKGDSGGPLMILYRGRYFVAGVVSGKRADSPCGTEVPSLYTNVYHYLDWIRSNIRN